MSNESQMTHPNPQEGDARCLSDGCGVHIVETISCHNSSDQVAEEQRDDDLSIAHEGRAEDLNDDQGHKDEEAQSYIFWCTEGELHVTRCATVWDDLQCSAFNSAQ